jgi:prepilin signal peptidase PulO-like enzyme (type II secretory pathway)
MDWAQISNTAASVLVALTCTVFAVVYHLHAPWRSTTVGRHVMTFTLAIGALGIYTVLIALWPDGLAASILRTVRTVLLVFIAGLVVQRTRMVLKAQHRGALLNAGTDRSDPPA